MTPIAHLLTSWIIATKTTNNVRDVRLVTLAGILPDADGFGLVVDLIKDPSLQQSAFYYQKYHHWLARNCGRLGNLLDFGLFCAAARAGFPFLPAGVSRSSSMRFCRFARTDSTGFMADLLFGTHHL